MHWLIAYVPEPFDLTIFRLTSITFIYVHFWTHINQHISHAKYAMFITGDNLVTMREYFFSFSINHREYNNKKE